MKFFMLEDHFFIAKELEHTNSTCNYYQIKLGSNYKRVIKKRSKVRVKRRNVKLRDKKKRRKSL